MRSYYNTRYGNFQHWPTLEEHSKVYGRRGNTLCVYQDLERNKGFEVYLGQITDPSGNVLANVLRGEPTEIMAKLMKIEKILTGEDQ